MTSQEPVALFIDVEHLDDGFKTRLGRGLEPEQLMTKARVHGQVNLALAYADVERYSEEFLRRFVAAGISIRAVAPANAAKREPSSAGMDMTLDIIDCLLDRPGITTLVLMTGESMLVQTIARARFRFQKRVVLSGVVGGVPQDLSLAADHVDLITDGA